MMVGEKIRQLRIHKKMTQDQLVQGISSVAYLSRIENGKSKPSSSFLKKVSTRLHISIDDLLNESMDKKEQKVLEIISSYEDTGEITEADLIFLNISSKENHSPYILVRIYTFLITFHMDKDDIPQAKRAYESSNYIIPYEINHLYADIYTDYFIICGNLFYRIQIYHEADNFYTRAEGLMIPEETENNARLFYNISLAKQKTLENKTIALYYSKKAYELFLKLADNENISKVLITRGVQYHLIKEYKKSLESLLEARNYINIDIDKKLNAMIEYNLGKVYHGLNDIDKAIHHFQESMKINSLLNSVSENIYSLRSLIEIYQDRNQWDIVHGLLEEALQIANSHDLNYMLIELKAIYAKGYYIRGDKYMYEKEMQQVIEDGIKLQQNLLVRTFSLELADHFYTIRSYKKSAYYSKLARQHEDTLSSVTLTHL